MLLFIPQTPLSNLFLIRLDNVDFSLYASTPAIQNKTNEGISKLLKQVRQLHILISTSESLTQLCSYLPGFMKNKVSIAHADSSQTYARKIKQGQLYWERMYNCMTKIIKPDLSPREFKCRTGNTMWSSYMKNSILCTDITERHGLHDFDFAKPII